MRVTIGHARVTLRHASLWMTSAEHRNRAEYTDAWWLQESPSPQVADSGLTIERAAKSVERPREAELCRFALAGVMPTPSDRGRRLSAAAFLRRLRSNFRDSCP